MLARSLGPRQRGLPLLFGAFGPLGADRGEHELPGGVAHVRVPHLGESGLDVAGLVGGRWRELLARRLGNGRRGERSHGEPELIFFRIKIYLNPNLLIVAGLFISQIFW